MNGQQKAVLWIGLILVGLNLVARWSDIRGVIFTGAGITGGIPSGSGSTSGGSSFQDQLNQAIKRAFHQMFPGTLSAPTPAPKHKSSSVTMV